MLQLLSPPDLPAAGRSFTAACILHNSTPPLVSRKAAHVKSPCLTTPEQHPASSLQQGDPPTPGHPQHARRHPTLHASGQQHSERIIVELCRHHALLALRAHAQALDVDTQVKLLTGEGGQISRKQACEECQQEGVESSGQVIDNSARMYLRKRQAHCNDRMLLVQQRHPAHDTLPQAPTYPHPYCTLHN